MELELVGSNGETSGENESTAAADVVDDSAELAQSAALEELIGNRVTDDVFPLILPTELKNSQAASQAKLDLNFVKESEMVRLQTYLERRFDKYRASRHEKTDMTDTQLRTAYGMEAYYTHVNHFLCAETLLHRDFRHKFKERGFLPLISPDALDSVDEQAAGQACLDRISTAVSRPSAKLCTFEFCQTLDQALWTKFNEVEEMARYIDTPLEELLATFLKSEYYPTMSATLDNTDKPQLAQVDPAVPVTAGDASPEEQKRRMQLIEDLESADTVQVEKTISEELEHLEATLEPQVLNALLGGSDAAYREKR